MTRIIECEDGVVVSGETDDELVQRLEEHLRRAHPSLAGTLSRTEILALAREGGESRREA